MQLKEVFSEIFRRRVWQHAESVSGTGSDADATRVIKDEIINLVNELDIKSFFDCACGDFNWMRDVVPRLDNVEYVATDIVPELVKQNQLKYPKVEFWVTDITRDSLPKMDLMMCRDCLVHLSFANTVRFIKNFVASGSTYLLTTSFTRDSENVDIPEEHLIGWRPLNLQLRPFNFPAPLRTIVEVRIS